VRSAADGFSEEYDDAQFKRKSSPVIQDRRDIPINRLGFGAMRITGRGIWGEPGRSVRRRSAP